MFKRKLNEMFQVDDKDGINKRHRTKKNDFVILESDEEYDEDRKIQLSQNRNPLEELMNNNGDDYCPRCQDEVMIHLSYILCWK